METLTKLYVFKYHMHIVIFIIFVVLIGPLTSSSGLAQYLRKYSDSTFIANDKHHKPPSTTAQNVKQNLRWERNDTLSSHSSSTGALSLGLIPPPVFPLNLPTQKGQRRRNCKKVKRGMCHK